MPFEENDEFSGSEAGVNVAFTDTVSSAFSLSAGRWRFIATQDVWVRRGGTAAAENLSSDFWPAGTVWFEKVSSNDVKHSGNSFTAIRSTTSGSLYVRRASR